MPLINIGRRLLRALRRHDGRIGRALDAARAEQLALDILFGECRLDAVRLGHACRRTVEARGDATGILGFLIASARYFLRQRMRLAAAEAIAQRGIDQRDEKCEGADEKDDLKTHGLLPICWRGFSRGWECKCESARRFAALNLWNHLAFR